MWQLFTDVSGQIFLLGLLTHEDGTDTLSRNVNRKLEFSSDIKDFHQASQYVSKPLGETCKVQSALQLFNSNFTFCHY